MISPASADRSLTALVAEATIPLDGGARRRGATPIRTGGSSIDDQKRQEEPTKDAELKRPEEAIDDLEPDERDRENVKGGGYYLKIKMDD